MATDTAVASRPGASGSASRRTTARSRRGRTVAVLLPLVLVLVAGLLRFYLLGNPERIYFDETYYANDARHYLERGVEEGFAVHPPVGKWVIAGGIALLGFDSFGWRAGVAAAGTLTVLAVYLAGLRLFRRRGIAALAALLLAVDGLAFTMSRIAMLDGILALFVVVGFHQLLVDRDQQWAAVPPGRAPQPASEQDVAGATDSADGRIVLPRRPHLHRWLAGVAFGLALATKWSALLAIGAAGLFVLGSELAWRRRLTGRWFVRPWRIVASGTATLVLLPLAVYAASYTGWFANFPETRLGASQCPEGACAGVSALDMAATWWQDQVDIARFHRDLEAEHPYRASATTWPILRRPVAYYYESCDDVKLAAGECVVKPGNVEEILGIGNPGVWWLALLAYPLLVWRAVRNREWQAWAVLAFLLVQYLPWLLASRPVFLFYMTPVVPFVCLALAYAAWQATAVPLLRWVPAFVAVVAVGGFLFWYPLYTGLEISKSAWDLRMWFPSWV